MRDVYFANDLWGRKEKNFITLPFFMCARNCVCEKKFLDSHHSAIIISTIIILMEFSVCGFFSSHPCRLFSTLFWCERWWWQKSWGGKWVNKLCREKYAKHGVNMKINWNFFYWINIFITYILNLKFHLKFSCKINFI